MALGGAPGQTAAWEPLPGGRCRAVQPVGAGRTGFTALPPRALGIDFVNWIPESRHLTNQILLNGAGVAAGDVDGDGRTDLYFANLTGANALYRNLGNWRFTNVTATAGVACRGLTSTGVALADLDGDGDLDLLVNTLGNGTRVFFNDGRGRFAEAAFRLNPGGPGMAMALADVDGDGFLDVYLGNYRASALMDMPNARATFKRDAAGRLEIETLNGRPITDPDLTNRFVISPRGGIQELGVPDVFYRSQGGTNFVRVPWTGGAFLDADGHPLTGPPRDWALGVHFRDANGDGRPDLYVCNDFRTPDRFWLNQGNGTFRLADWTAQRKTPLSSMAADFADVNRDGVTDFLVLDMLSRDHRRRMLFLEDRTPAPRRNGVIRDRPQYELDMLFLNRGDDTYAEIGQLAGVDAAEWAWTCAFLDVDLDGWEDLLVSNGMQRAARDADVVERLKQMRARGPMSAARIFAARRMFPREETPNLIFRNNHDLTFTETGAAWGFARRDIGNSLAFADLDNDGDLDVVINCFHAPPLLLRNDSPAARVAVRLAGRPPNTRGIGARVRVRAPGLPLQQQEIIAGGRYLASDDPVRAFAAGAPTNRVTLEVRWPGGRVSRLSGPANRIYEVREADAAPSPAPPAAPKEKPWFADVSARLNHRHHDDYFDDFARQLLIPRRYSQLGPGLAWADLNGDGREDLLIGGGAGGVTEARLNDGQGGFTPARLPVGKFPFAGETAGLLVTGARGQPPLLIEAVSGYENAAPPAGALRLTRWPDGPVGALGAGAGNVGALALADVDGDGVLDLFVGGDVQPGRYPAAGPSRLFRGTLRDGRLSFAQPDPVNAATLAGLGRVGGAVFSDFDGDGDPDLAVAIEWGPVRILRNDGGRFSDATAAFGLADRIGWWTSVATGDFDGDGRPDLVAGNWGRNSPYQRHRHHPLELYSLDYDEDGVTEVIEAYYDPAQEKVVPMRKLSVMTAAFPLLRELFPSHRAWSTADVREVLDAVGGHAERRQANWLESTLFLNRGGRFAARALPVEAQMTPVFGMGVGDFDGDGRLDLFLAQNFFAARPGIARTDAGRGLLLRGDGRGGFAAVSGPRGGVKIYGEQRGVAVADYDGDGRPDLAVAQNANVTRLFHNEIAPPGWRIQLTGPPGNPRAVGAAARVLRAEGAGPLYEVQAGAGWRSQSSATLVIAARPGDRAVWIRWPGGRETTTPLPAAPGAVRLTAPQ